MERFIRYSSVAVPLRLIPSNVSHKKECIVAKGRAFVLTVHTPDRPALRHRVTRGFFQERLDEPTLSSTAPIFIRDLQIGGGSLIISGLLGAVARFRRCDSCFNAIFIDLIPGNGKQCGQESPRLRAKNLRGIPGSACPRPGRL